MATRHYAAPMGYKEVEALGKPDTRRDRDWAKRLPRDWYHCDYPRFLELLESREKELGINHANNSSSR